MGEDNKEERTYLTSYCNFHHRLSDGRAIGHECIVIPPEALQAEREERHDDAIEIIAAVLDKSQRGR